MNQVLSAIYYLPNAFLFYETTAEDNDKLLDNNLESDNIIQEQKIAEKKPQLTTKYVNKILIKNTERIILWNGFNLTWWNHLTYIGRWIFLIIMQDFIILIKNALGDYWGFILEYIITIL